MNDKMTYSEGDLEIIKKPPVVSAVTLQQPRFASLISHQQQDWQTVFSRLIVQAYNDHAQRLPRRTGQWLRSAHVRNARRRHVRLCSTIYNQFRDELETSLDR